jgi:hypothetical protein
MRYIRQDHRSEPHSRIEDWLTNFSSSGIRKCAQGSSTAASPASRNGAGWEWTRACRSRAPATKSSRTWPANTWFCFGGLFDNELYVEYEGVRTGPYYPVAGPIPLNRYRAFKRGAADARADRIRTLADQLKLPIEALAGKELHLVH